MPALRSDDLQPTGGSWHGLLYENEQTGYPLQLTWSFSLDFAAVMVHGEQTTPSLTVEWIHAGTSSWMGLEGETFEGESFHDPIEASFYLFEHHRFDRARVDIEEQAGTNVNVKVELSGDLDHLGVDHIATNATLEFAGIYVQADATRYDPKLAAAALQRFTLIDGLTPRPRGHNVLFAPSRIARP